MAFYNRRRDEYGDAVDPLDPHGARRGDPGELRPAAVLAACVGLLAGLGVLAAAAGAACGLAWRVFRWVGGV